MVTNPILTAARAKGPLAFLRRAGNIAGRYGLTSAQMDRALRQFSDVLVQYNCGATFPVTAVSLKRHTPVIQRYRDQNIEFAVHGYTHVDYSRLAPEARLQQMQLSRRVFADVGILATGFRSPYLSRDESLNAAVEAAGFAYVSNQPVLWDVLDSDALDLSARTGYARALTFYDPWRAAQRPSLPRLDGGLVEIPVSLPDDEILVERLGGQTDLITQTWLRILSQTHQRGELFTLQLHPERIAFCTSSLQQVLAEARRLTPGVWCARLDEIAAWWKARASAGIEMIENGGGEFDCIVSGPGGTTVLARGLEVSAPSLPWSNGYRVVKAERFTFRSLVRPLIGVSPSTSEALISFLRLQGYIVEISPDDTNYAYYLDRMSFEAGQEETILAKIEESGCPLLRLGRWPDGAHSALAITGDVDAFDVWDYGLRLMGK